MKSIVLNLLVFNQEFLAGKSQKELVEKAVLLGFDKIEVRREYFRDLKSEIPEIKQLVDTHGIELFYSVPEEVFVNGTINSNLVDYLKEANEMSAQHIKWNIGDYAHFTGNLAELSPLTEMGVNVTIENDQTNTSGKIKAIQTFMKAVSNEGLKIGYVYDLGNWRFVGEDEEVAAEQLKQYVTYIHVKDVESVEGQPVAAGLDKGDINWRQVLQVLPQDVPVAIEYPTEKDSEILEAKELLEEA